MIISTTPIAHGPKRLPAAERRRLLDERVRLNIVKGGATVESHGDFDAVLVRGRRPNHVLHLILTLVTLGAWGLVWLILALGMRPTRVLLTVDEYGNVELSRGSQLDGGRDGETAAATIE